MWGRDQSSGADVCSGREAVSGADGRRKCVVILAVISHPPEHPLVILLISQNSREVVVPNPYYHSKGEKGGSERLKWFVWNCISNSSCYLGFMPWSSSKLVAPNPLLPAGILQQGQNPFLVVLPGSSYCFLDRLLSHHGAPGPWAALLRGMVSTDICKLRSSV